MAFESLFERVSDFFVDRDAALKFYKSRDAQTDPVLITEYNAEDKARQARPFRVIGWSVVWSKPIAPKA
jgi:hypothetical protein